MALELHPNRHQYAYSPYGSLYVSLYTAKENFSYNQEPSRTLLPFLIQR